MERMVREEDPSEWDRERERKRKKRKALIA